MGVLGRMEYMLKWYGHLARMEDNRLRNRIVTWWPGGRRQRGWPERKWKEQWSWKIEHLTAQLTGSCDESDWRPVTGQLCIDKSSGMWRCCVECCLTPFRRVILPSSSGSVSPRRPEDRAPYPWKLYLHQHCYEHIKMLQWLVYHLAPCHRILACELLSWETINVIQCRFLKFC